MAIYELDNKKPKLPKKGSYWVASNASVIGDVEVHEGASIWFNTVVRGDCEKIIIGKNSTIQGLKVLGIDLEDNLILIKGSVPGSNGSVVYVNHTRKG